jgi:hypothetical protein
LKTAVGVLAIDEVETVPLAKITAVNAKRAGYSSLDELKAELLRRDEGDVYRVKFRHVGADPRIALRAKSKIGRDEFDMLIARLQRLDGSAPWAKRTLALIARHPGRRAAELAAELKQQTASFKLNVRKLKALGLTESLEVGYRLSPRGRTVLARLGK